MSRSRARVLAVALVLAGCAPACTPRGDRAPDAGAEAGSGLDADRDLDAGTDADSGLDADRDDEARSDADGDEAEPPAPFLVAVYDDTAEPDAAAWAEGLDLVEAALDRAGLEHRRIDRLALNTVEDALEPFDAVVFGGGFAYPGYTLAITAAAKARLRRFVEQGGVFAGICAGAYFACDAIRYEGEDWADESGYDLDLYPGTCTGPLASLGSYPDHVLAELDLAADHPALSALGAADRPRWTVWYAGGPWFGAAGPEVETLATYAGEGLPEAGLPAVVAVPRGSGVSLLFGPHPEIAEPPVGADAGRLLGEVLRFELEAR